ncbi:hypothetical protein TNCV_1966451 [Trichonephila clavipes]|nr:hypothetical protein TNCV_1966451 [Trichonephila clavipes]
MARIGQQKRCCVPSGQRQATYFCSDSTASLGAWLGSFHAFTMKSGPGTKHLTTFLALQNFLSDKKLGSREDCENRLLDVFANEDQDFYERGIMKLYLKGNKLYNKTVHI